MLRLFFLLFVLVINAILLLLVNILLLWRVTQLVPNHLIWIKLLIRHHIWLLNRHKLVILVAVHLLLKQFIFKLIFGPNL